MKQTKKHITNWILLLTLLGIFPNNGQASIPLLPPDNQEAQSYVSGEILVKFQPGFTPIRISGKDFIFPQRELNELFTEAGISISQSSAVLGNGSQMEIGSKNYEIAQIGLERIFRIRLSAGKDVLSAIKILNSHPAIDYAEPNYLVQSAIAPDDPYFFQQWGLSWIGAESAWDIEQGSTTNIIAILDTGLDLDHPDFSGRLWINTGEISANGIDDDSNGYIDDINGWNFVEDISIPQDDSGHGTHVAGTAAATGNNAIGVAGVDWNARIMPLRILNAGGAGTHADAAAALVYAVEQGSQVINMSFGAYTSSQTLQDAVAYASQSALLIGAAGNNARTDPFYPAAYPEVVAVASIGPGDIISPFTNYGDWVDLSAPGETIWSTIYDNGYVAWSGTSMAAPFVSGAASLLLSHFPGLTLESLRQQLLKTASDLNPTNPAYDGLLGAGRVELITSLSTQPRPQIAFLEYSVDAVVSGKPEPDSTVEISITLGNTWADAFNITGVLSTTNSLITLDNDTAGFGDIPGNSSGSNLVPFTITLAPTIPYNSQIDFRLDLTADGAYSDTLQFTVTTASSLQNIGALTIDEDTVWDSSRQFIIGEQVRVMEGVTLTIQAGVLIQFETTGSLVISGTLVADGTSISPIIFDSTGIGPWGGIAFLEPSGDAILDPSNNYLEGSVLRFVQIKQADKGIQIQSASPLITENIISENNIGVEIVGGEPLIFGNTFIRNGTGLNLSSGSGVRVIGNLFQENTTGISGTGEAIEIQQNQFQNNQSGLSLEILDPSILEENLFEQNVTGGSLSLDWPTGERSNLDVALIPWRNEYLVVWQDGRDPLGDHIIGQFLSWDGTLGDEILVAGDGESVKPRLDCNPASNTCLVIYHRMDPVSGNYQLEGQMIAADGNLSGSLITIASFTGAQNNSVVAADTLQGGYLVVWNDSSDGDYDIYAQRVTASGGLNGSQITVISDAVNQIGLELTFNALSNEYMIVWAENKGLMSAWDVYGRRVSSDGTFPGIPFTITGAVGDQRNPSVDSETVLGWYTIVWDDNRNGGFDIFGRRVTKTGVLYGNDAQIYTAAPDASDFVYPKVNYSPIENEHIVSWIEKGSTEYVVGQRISSGGALVNLNNKFPISNSSTSKVSYRSVYNNNQNEFLSAWLGGTNSGPVIFGQRFEPDGVLLDNPGTVRDESDPVLNFPIVLGSTFSHNTILGNQIGLTINSVDPDLLIIQNNNILRNSVFNAMNNSSEAINLINNFWDYNSVNEIIPTISGSAIVSPFLQAPDQVAPAIFWRLLLSREGDPTPVEAIEGVDYGPVGAEVLTLTIDFSKPMDTSVTPYVTIGDGSALSYTPTHIVSFGQWTNPMRWVGQFQVDWYTGDGIKRISIEGARDETSGFEIPADRRFTFEVSILSSASINAQPGWEQVYLTWLPAEIPTLAGYNVFRATQSGGPYIRVNPMLISTTSFTDTGLTNYLPYYYKISVVNTSLEERDYTEEFAVSPGDPTPPSIPVIVDDGICTPYTNWLYASWSAIDPESGIAEYQYSIGTSPGSTQVINWTSVESNTFVLRMGLTLVEGNSYYFSVRAKNGADAWSAVGISDGITVDFTCSPSRSLIFLPLIAK